MPKALDDTAFYSHRMKYDFNFDLYGIVGSANVQSQQNRGTIDLRLRHGADHFTGGRDLNRRRHSRSEPETVCMCPSQRIHGRTPSYPIGAWLYLPLLDRPDLLVQEK